MRTLAVVPARGGSKGLPNKNARLFNGASLLARAIRIGLETCDDLVVTTDSPELAVLASAYEAKVRLRAAQLARDDTPMLPVVQDAIRGRVEPGDVVVLLQPTQPLRKAEQVREALEVLHLTGCDSVVTVTRVPEQYVPDRVLVLEGEYLTHATDLGAFCAGRQDARPAFVRDGTVYVTRAEVVLGGSLYGARCRPIILDGETLSIDTLADFERLEAQARC